MRFSVPTREFVHPFFYFFAGCVGLRRGQFFPRYCRILSRNACCSRVSIGMFARTSSMTAASRSLMSRLFSAIFFFPQFDGGLYQRRRNLQGTEPAKAGNNKTDQYKGVHQRCLTEMMLLSTPSRERGNKRKDGASLIPFFLTLPPKIHDLHFRLGFPARCKPCSHFSGLTRISQHCASRSAYPSPLPTMYRHAFGSIGACVAGACP